MSDYAPSSKGENGFPDLEGDLISLWSKVPTIGRPKASLFNLIVHVTSLQSRAKLRATIQSVVDRYPCRVIFITADPSFESSFITAKASLMQERPGSQFACCELIDVDVGIGKIERIPFLLLAHLLPDVPLYLLLDHPPQIDEKIFAAVAPMAQRVIFSSDQISSVKGFCQKITPLLEEKGKPFIDLNWAALASWREIFMKIFLLEEQLAYLPLAERVLISYSSKGGADIPHPEMQSLYLLGWLANQMGWRWEQLTSSEGGYVFLLSDPANRHIESALQHNEQSTYHPGTILSLEISCSNGYNFQFQLLQDQPKVVVHISSEERCELPITLPLVDIRRGQELTRELFYSLSSSSYRTMVRFLTQMPSSGELL